MAASADREEAAVPLIGATAAYGMCLALREDASDESLEGAYATLIATRPTAVNLKWALDEIMATVRNRPRAERSSAAYRRAAELCEQFIARRVSGVFFAAFELAAAEGFDLPDLVARRLTTAGRSSPS